MTTTRSQGENSQSQGASAPGSQLPPNTNNTPPQVEDQTGGETPGQGEPATGTGIPPNLTQDQQISFLFNAIMAMKKDNEVTKQKDKEQRQKDAQIALENALPTKSKNIQYDPSTIPLCPQGKSQTALSFYKTELAWKKRKPDHGFSTTVPLSCLHDAKLFATLMESSIKKSYDSTDVVSKHTTISTLHQSVVDKHLSLHDSLKDDGEINVNLSIIEYLSKKANKHWLQ